jgi:hypothetical protein
MEVRDGGERGGREEKSLRGRVGLIRRKKEVEKQ